MSRHTHGFTLIELPAVSDAKRAAFTLVELLVVITIIVILISMLMPALDQAIYQAELASCAARQDAIVSGAVLYAFDHKRYYPKRPGNLEDDTSTSWSPFLLAMGNQSNNPLNKPDLRPMIKSYIGPKLWQCVMLEQIDLSEEATLGFGRIYGGYNLFFGFTYLAKDNTNWPNKGIPGEGMLKMGDRWAFTNSDSIPTTHRFNLLVTDIDFNHNGPYSHGSHQDDAGRMTLQTWRGQTGDWAPDGALYGSLFRGPGRGLIGFNAGREDGAVLRFNNVKSAKYSTPEFTDIAQMDTRLGYPGEWMNVPTN